MTRLLLQLLLPSQYTARTDGIDMARPAPCPLCDRPIGVDAAVRIIQRRSDGSDLLAHRDCTIALARHRRSGGRGVAYAALTAAVAAVLIGVPLLVAWIDGLLPW